MANSKFANIGMSNDTDRLLATKDAERLQRAVKQSVLAALNLKYQQNRTSEHS